VFAVLIYEIIILLMFDNPHKHTSHKVLLA
jgi:hypothetical protein